MLDTCWVSQCVSVRVVVCTYEIVEANEERIDCGTYILQRNSDMY